METPSHIAAQRLLAGHVALDFVNTAYGEGGAEPFECLTSFEDLVAWGRRAGIVTDDEAGRLLAVARRRPSAARRALRRALTVRSILDDVFRSIALGRGEPPPETLAALKKAERDAIAHAELLSEGDLYRWAWKDPGDLDRVLWPLVHAATSLLESGLLDRVKSCDACGWLFFDASKNRSRRWCTMEDGCGEQVKMRRYVARRARRRAAHDKERAAAGPSR
ncbi:MAG TPA: ABATE domain-containing protein [Actinomycetota bacterium]|jgi:predicted RNA-binding Zn ribbon-like protein|nr:ABATE domain-containing protein [Actinomycetota bacterium]